MDFSALSWLYPFPVRIVTRPRRRPGGGVVFSVVVPAARRRRSLALKLVELEPDHPGQPNRAFVALDQEVAASPCIGQHAQRKTTARMRQPLSGRDPHPGPGHGEGVE